MLEGRWIERVHVNNLIQSTLSLFPSFFDSSCSSTYSKMPKLALMTNKWNLKTYSRITTLTKRKLLSHKTCDIYHTWLNEPNQKKKQWFFSYEERKICDCHGLCLNKSLLQMWLYIFILIVSENKIWINLIPTRYILR